MSKRELQAIKTVERIGPPSILLTLYLLQVSILGVGLALPFAFFWLMWTLNGIKKGLEVQKERLEKIEAR